MKNEAFQIKVIFENKNQLLPLLLIGDEDEQRIRKYLENGICYGLFEKEEIRAILVVSQQKERIEIENLSVLTAYQKQGLGSQLIQAVCQMYAENEIVLGTDDVSGNVDFYKKNGFEVFKREKNFFLEHYPRPLFENGVQLVDKIYLRRTVKDHGKGIK